jgi:hypothetical protein
MEQQLRSIGGHLRRLFSAFTRRPLEWAQIDALASLEEREEALRQPDADAAVRTAPKDRKER